MHCTNCGKNVPSDSKFCQSCGNATLTIQTPIDLNSKDGCQLCGIKAPIKYNEFYANIGMLIARRQKHIKGKMCRSCTDKNFWNFTFTNLFLGWWGVVSFFATIIFIINNTFRYLGTLSLKKHY